MRALCRLSVLYRIPLHDVAQWPAADIRLLQAYLAKQPAPEERVEIAVALLRRLVTSYLSPAGTAPSSVESFLPYHDPWPSVADDDRYSDVDRSFLAVL